MNRHQRHLSTLLLILVTLTATFSSPALAQEQADPVAADPVVADPVVALMARLTPEEKIGQLFLTTFDGASAATDTDIGKLIREQHIGGVVLLSISKNFTNNADAPRQVAALANELQAGALETGAGIPLFVAIDHEGDGFPYSRLTGGMTPMSVTLAREEHFDAFRSSNRSDAFFHGHTFTAHPIGCAAALASMELVLERDVPARLDQLGARIEARLAVALASALAAGRVAHLRRCGGIVAFDLATEGPAGYLADMAPALRRRAIEAGVLLRPLGNVLYAMPPASTSDAQADRIAEAMVAILPRP